MAVMSRLDVQKQILADLNGRVDSLVSQILARAEIEKSVVNTNTMPEIQQIIKGIEGMEFDGNVDLLKQTVAVYEKAINAIDEQIKSKEMNGYAEYSKTSLEEAKKLLETQSKDGRVGTIFSKLEELSEAEKSGDIEKRYNDDKIDELNYNIEGIEKEEKEKVDPYNKILAETRKEREKLQNLDSIVAELKKLVTERKDIIKKLSEPIEETEKVKLRTNLKEIEKEIKSVPLKARKDEKDKQYDMNENEDISSYISRVNDTLQDNITDVEKTIQEKLIKMKSMDIYKDNTLHEKVENYLSEYMIDSDESRKKIHGLTQKIEIDRNMTRKAIEKDDSHKELKDLQSKKEVYEKRNEELQQETSESQAYESPVGMVEYKKFDWRHPFKSLKQRWNTRKNNSKKEETTSVDKIVLKEIEKSVKSSGKGFKEQYKVEEKDRISAEVETSLNTKREQFYASLEQKEKDDGSR